MQAETISKNKIRKMRRYNTEGYYKHLIDLFSYSSHNHFVYEINRSLMLDSRNITSDFIEYCRKHDTQLAKEIEPYVASIVEKLARAKCGNFDCSRGQGQ